MGGKVMDRRMIYLPQKVWDVRKHRVNSGFYVIFQDEEDAWYGVQTFADGRPPTLHHFENPPDLKTFGDYLPPVKVEVRAEDYRVHLYDYDRIALTCVCGGSSTKG